MKDMEKTISYLNGKVWYRILKVFFILVVLIGITAYNALILDEYGLKTINPDKTVIQCKQRNSIDSGKSFSPKDIGLGLESSDFPNGSFNYKYFYTHSYDFEISKILETCYDNNKALVSSILQGDRDIYELQKLYELQVKYDFWNNGGNSVTSKNQVINEGDERLVSAVTELSEYRDEVKDIYGDNRAKLLDFNASAFEIIPVLSYAGFLKLFLLGNSIILVVFEIIRRSFYFIALGTLRPKK